MNPAVLPLLMIGLFVVVFGLLVWMAIRQVKRSSENMRRLADVLGLKFVSKPPAFSLFYGEERASGLRRGRQVDLFAYATGSGRSRVQWCAVAAAVPASCALTFHLQRQGFGTKVMGLFGAKEIQVGDAEFDAAWFIQTNQPDYLRSALLPEVREKINALVRELGVTARGMEFRLDKGAVRYAEQGNFAGDDPCERVQRAADIVCDLAEVAEVCTPPSN